MGEKKKKTLHLRAGISELTKEVVERDPKLPIIKSGVDNLYPERIERVINNSPTGKPATKLFKKYTLGRGIPELNKIIVNKEKQTKFLQFLRNFTESYTKQNGVFIHVQWTPEIENGELSFFISSWEVLPYKYCRVGKKDDKNWHGKIAVYEHWDKEKISEGDIKLVDVFNPNPKVIKAQIEKCEGESTADKAKNYKGQILFINPENSIYPLAHIDEAYDHADSEYRAALYVNTLMRQGFVGTTMFITPPLEGDKASISDHDFEELEDYEKKEIQQIRSEAEDVRNLIKSTKGVENAGSTIHLEMQPGDNFEKMEDAIIIKQFEHQIDDKTFKATEEASEKAILKAVNQIPGILLNQSDASLFGQGGEQLKQAKIAFQENCEEGRMIIEDTLETLMMYTKDLKGKKAKIEKLIDTEDQNQKVDGTN